MNWLHLLFRSAESWFIMPQHAQALLPWSIWSLLVQIWRMLIGKELRLLWFRVWWVCYANPFWLFWFDYKTYYCKVSLKLKDLSIYFRLVGQITRNIFFVPWKRKNPPCHLIMTMIWLSSPTYSERSRRRRIRLALAALTDLRKVLGVRYILLCRMVCCEFFFIYIYVLEHNFRQCCTEYI